MTSGQTLDTASHVVADAKWGVLIGDKLSPMPRRKMKSKDILHQAGYESDLTLVRDFDTPNDIGFSPEAVVDLGEGNVFRVSSSCERTDVVSCSGSPKLAFIVDDAWEVTVQPHQTGETLRALLGLSDDAELFRDYESPADEPIDDDEPIVFHDGPVFTVREPSQAITIIVNGQKKHVVGRMISFEALVVLAYGTDDAGPTIVYAITYERGPGANPEGTLSAGRSVKVRNGMVFNVQRTDKS
jgi:hypothetical protein